VVAARSSTVNTIPLRILQVNSLFNGGGTDNQTLELALSLRELGVEITLAIPAGSRWEPKARATGLLIETFPPSSPLKFAMMSRLRALIRERRIQVVHAHQGRDYWPAIIAARSAGNGCRVVVTRHLITRPRTMSRWFLLRFAEVVAVSHAVEKVLRQELSGPPERVHQIYGGINTEYFRLGKNEKSSWFRQQNGWSAEAVVFGVVGAFHLPCGKGQIEFLEAAAKFKNEFPQARFAIVGQGSMETLLRQTIANAGLEKIVTMVPFTDDIAIVMNALDVLVHPAVGTEALGLVLWEAMACGKPVIASRLDGIPESFIEGEHGLLVPPGDAAALTEAMRMLLKEPERRIRFGRAGREFVRRNFTRAAQAQRMMDLYLKLCARGVAAT